MRLTAPAFSAARLARQLAKVQRGNPGVTEVAAEWVHFLAVSRDLTGAEAALVERLLTYGPTLPPVTLTGRQLVVVPRVGTISPWSSKATDIAHTSGLEAVRRIERGVRWTVAGEIRDEKALRDALADRMTESVLGSIDEAAALLFQAG